MKTVNVYLFSIKNKESGLRELMTLTGTPKSNEDFKEAFLYAEDYDLRTIRWIDSYEVVSSFAGPSVSPVYDSRDNVFVEAKESEL